MARRSTASASCRRAFDSLSLWVRPLRLSERQDLQCRVKLVRVCETQFGTDAGAGGPVLVSTTLIFPASCRSPSRYRKLTPRLLMHRVDRVARSVEDHP